MESWLFVYFVLDVRTSARRKTPKIILAQHLFYFILFYCTCADSFNLKTRFSQLFNRTVGDVKRKMERLLDVRCTYVGADFQRDFVTVAKHCGSFVCPRNGTPR